MADRPEVQVITNVNTQGPMVIDEAAKARLIQMAMVVRKEAETQARTKADDDFSGGRN
jgi:hypothetical protein